MLEQRRAQGRLFDDQQWSLQGSTRAEDRFKYEIRFPERTGETYSLRHSPDHRWYYYPKMTKVRDGWREGGREGWREGWMEGGREWGDVR